MTSTQFIHEYSGKSSMSSRCGTKSFSPLPKTDLKFHFDWRNFPDLKLYKSGNANMYSSLQMDVDVSLYDKYEDSFWKYKPVSSVNIQKMVEIKFEPSHENKVRPPDCKFYDLTYRMQFWDHFEESSSVCDWFQRDKDNESGAQLPKETDACSLSDLKLFVKKFTTIYESGVLSDLKFILGENSLPAHKLVLAAHSPVFMTMLTSDFQESQIATITITDSTFEVFGDFLKYLYSGEIVDRTWNKVMELYKLADKYDVDILKRECQKTILSFLNMDSVCEVLVLAHDHDDAELKNVAKEYAFTRMKELMSTGQWKELNESHPLLANDVLTSFVQHQK